MEKENVIVGGKGLVSVQVLGPSTYLLVGWISILPTGLQLRPGYPCLNSELSPFFLPPSFSQFLSYHFPSPTFFQSPELWPRPPFIPLRSGVAIIFIPTHSRILTSLRILRDSHEFIEFPWKLFQTPVKARYWILFITISSQLPASFGPHIEFLHDCFRSSIPKGPLG